MRSAKQGNNLKMQHNNITTEWLEDDDYGN